MGCSTSLAVDISAERRLHTFIDMLFDAYGKPTEQVGYTDGHYCLTKEDRDEAARCGSSLLYGEILAVGITKLLDTEHLHAARAQVLFDLGMGVGKLVMQAFLQYPNLKLIRGVELAYSRFKLAEEALLRLVSLQSDRFEVEERTPGEYIRVHTVGRRKRRALELRRGDMWAVRDVSSCDIIVMHTELTPPAFPKFRRLVRQMKRGGRFVTYQDLSKHWPYSPPPFRQLEANVDESDQFATSWSALKGHHLYCWEKTAEYDRVASGSGELDLEESKEAIGQ
uniref:DOT1 domain-containing protein n=1 Tax=Bicosoecida sp. CB-2014 TaxID=1486930 RepID=A0A7S1CCX5_9STRA|mmetsp:Transcript_22149/g.77628  ORF Transcript_22149/g.77628 Transcript_22149/m.77628 type:complete len:281 (+) Transcript_22149:586-1428(+)